VDRAKIQEDEWRTKHEDLADQHRTPGTRKSLRAGLKAWLASDFYAQRRGKYVALQKGTKTIAVEDNA
jgi:hypothetical protein